MAQVGHIPHTGAVRGSGIEQAFGTPGTTSLKERSPSRTRVFRGDKSDFEIVWENDRTSKKGQHAFEVQ